LNPIVYLLWGRRCDGFRVASGAEIPLGKP
jgi:hypothetical protein